MTSTPPASPSHLPQRPASTYINKPVRSSSRMSVSTKTGGGIGSRASDEDSRTAVRVAVRIRPPLKPTDPGFELIPQRFQRSMVQTTSDTGLSIDSPQGRKLFVFDRVFGPDVSQDGIWDYLADSIDAFTQGYNVSLLAYGQSGAGKSYTMGTSGPLDQQDTQVMGVVPRAGTALFEKLDAQYGNSIAFNPRGHSNSLTQMKSPRGYGQRNSLGDRNWSLKATYVEIYNEHLRDLLVAESTPQGERNNVAIREDTKGNIILTGLRQVDIQSVDDLMNALNFGSTIRQTDATAINAKSSRSHAVFSLQLVQKRSKLPTSSAEKRFSVPIESMTGHEVSITTDSKLHFVDLAGSERLKNTGAQGERAKEGISINAGLASLGKVISQLSSRHSGAHVSYRDSKLTRLLQDSLGGNAITYMIACVTPAEFHLSETLNTVQYAQRARAIQSKPRIQQVEEGDKQALIERLKAEVSFLREQIRSAQESVSTPRGNGTAATERSERQSERQVELQNQLLDMQENYNALSQRHARLITEMAKAGEKASEDMIESDALQISHANDRLTRSNSFAEAVEAVVLEYEKTIESLEHSLSSTRTTLSSTETTLLEKETRCAYVETINTQLQTRLQKLMDREANTENYLHDLEAKLDGHTSGEEKNATIIMELRKEIARARENEASCEDYISTLEERLAEADQDGELMQREIDRLEQVVERQRSLGKLDSLLHELDHVDESDKNGPESLLRTTQPIVEPSQTALHTKRLSQLDESIPEHDEERPLSRTSTVKEQPLNEQLEGHEATLPDGDADADALAVAEVDAVAEPPQSPAQSKFVADKLESITQELVDLRVEHESTVDQYDALQARYEEAMRTMAELQDAVDEARQSQRTRDSFVSAASEVQNRPDSYQSDKETVDMKDDPRSSTSRSLSSELSSAMESSGTNDTSQASTGAEATSDDDAATTKPSTSSSDLSQEQHEQLAAEIEKFKTLADDRDAAGQALAERYAKLEEEHREALDMMEELKTDLSKARAVEASSPRNSSPVIRRKSSQNLLIIDRAHRSFASLRNIASENFEGKPDVMQNFELNLNSAMHELHSRSERIQELEAAVTTTKKEMETKMAIITGLTRERSSLSGSPLDISMVASMREKIEQSERELAEMREAHDAREQELTAELEGLRTAAANNSEVSTAREEATGAAEAAEADKVKEVKEVREAEEVKDVEKSEPPVDESQNQRLIDLETELSGWENKHKSVVESMQATEGELRASVAQLEDQLTVANTALEEARAAAASSSAAVLEAEQKHQGLVDFLRSEIDGYKTMITTHNEKIADMEKQHASTRLALEEMTAAHSTVSAEASHHQTLLAELQSQLSTHEETIRSHQDSLAQLRSSHEREIGELKAHEQKGYEDQVEVLMTEHADAIRKLEAEATDARDDLTKVATQVAFALGLDVSIEKLTERIDGLIGDQRAFAEEQKRTEEMERHVKDLSSINDKVLNDLDQVRTALAEMDPEADLDSNKSITEHVARIKGKMADLETRNKKASRMVEELEEQLQSNFDEAQMTNKRLSSMQTERAAQLDEANAARSKLQADLDMIREENSHLQARLSDTPEMRRSNSNSNIVTLVNGAVRKSASHTSLPSPPPAIPLPPLPGSAGASPSLNGGATSPTGNRPMSRDNMNISQITEDQEARIRTIEKHLYAERQLTQTLEEALSDLEKQSKKVKSDCDSWKKRAQELENEVKELHSRPAPEAQQDNRWSMLQVEEERKKRQAAEAARKQLEERMNAINKNKKKKGTLNCF